MALLQAGALGHGKGDFNPGIWAPNLRVRRRFGAATGWRLGTRYKGDSTLVYRRPILGLDADFALVQAGALGHGIRETQPWLPSLDSWG